MTQYAYFDSTLPDPKRVIGWYDTELFNYPNLPSSDNLLELTLDQWNARLSNTSGWAIENGKLVSYTPPIIPPTIAQLAQIALTIGLTITSTGNSSLNGTYPTNQAITAHIQSEVIALLINNWTAFSDGTTSITWVDKNSTNHTFSISEFREFSSAITAYVSALNKCINGTATSLPNSSVVIS